MMLRRSLFAIMVLLWSVQAMAQLPGGINIDQLSDQQLMQFVQSSNLSGLSEAELEAKARERGLSTDQIQKLKARVAGMQMSASPAKANAPSSAEPRKPISYLLPKAMPDSINGLLIYGSEIFTKDNLTFEPNLNIPTPNNYVLGAGDQLNVDVFGYSDKTQKYTISPDGTIRIPNIGPVKIAGLSIPDARVKLINVMSKVYPGLKGGNTGLELTLGQLRSIRVNLIGEITRPGTYTLSSVSTIANALYAAGGPSKIGSYRHIELVRAGKLVAKFDLYRYLFNGDLTENRLLQDDDVIKVSAYQNRVELNGGIKRKAVYELKPNESVSDLLRYAGGVSDDGNKKFVKITRYGDFQQELITIDSVQFSKFMPNSGDRVYVDVISARYSNRISIEGAVVFKGSYSLNVTPTLKLLINKAGLEEDAYLERAVISRKQKDLQPEILAVDLSNIIKGKEDVVLQREDSIYVFRRSELQQKQTILIEGEVNKPSEYPYAFNMQVQDAILMAGGYRDGATKKLVEVSRRIRGAETEGSFNYAKVYTIDLDSLSKETVLNYVLEPFDIIQVRRSPSYRPQGKITIEGEVNYPGNYTVQGSQERLSDLIKRAGGLKPGAYPEGALLLRKTFEGEANKNSQVLQAKINTFRASFMDSTKAAKADSLLMTDLKRVNVDLEKAIQNPGSIYDFYMIDGDVLSVPQPLQTVQTFSGVYFPKKILYRPHLTFKRVIKESGGALPTGQLGRAYVLYPNGKIKSAHRYVLFRTYPRLKPGAEIYVPEKKKGNGISTSEIVGFSGVLTSIVSMLYLITK